MSLLQAHDWRLDSRDDGAARVHTRPRADRPDSLEECVKYTCVRCKAELLLTKSAARQPPRYGCQGDA